MRKISFLVVMIMCVQALAQQEVPPDQNKQAPAPVATPEPEIVPYRTDLGWRFGLGLGFSVGSKLKFDNGTVVAGGASTSFTADLDYKEAAVLNFEGCYMPMNSWGIILGLQIDGEREFDKGTITGGGTTVSLSSSGGASKLQVTNVYGSASYRWDQFYIPFGLNVSAVKFTPVPGSTGTYDATGGVGAQVGIGFLPAEHLAFELTSRAVAVKLKTTTSSGIVDYGTGYLSSLIVMGKYIF